MGSKLVSETSCLTSTDIGIMLVKIQAVTGYDVEDIIRDRAVSQARAVQFVQIGKIINPNAPSTERTLSSVWLNNEEVLST